MHNAAAAANPALASLQLTTSTTGGLVLSTDASGDLIAAATAGDPPLITFNAPQIWDSTPPPASEPLATNGDGVTVDAASGDPAYSTTSTPGTGAQVATIPVSLSGSVLTLTPPASVLTGSSTTYPVYIDPTWHAVTGTTARSTQVFSGIPTSTSEYLKQEDARVGVCPANLDPRCNGIGVAHTYVQVTLPKQMMRLGTQISAATVMYSTEDWAASCTAEPVRLWHVNGTISAATNWNNAPVLGAAGTGYVAKTVGFGHPGCTPAQGYFKDDVAFSVQAFIQADVAKQSYQTFALQAGNEDTTNISTSELYWKKFKYSDFKLSVSYNNPPDQPTSLSTSPGGGCPAPPPTPPSSATTTSPSPPWPTTSTATSTSRPPSASITPAGPASSSPTRPSPPAAAIPSTPRASWRRPSS